MTGSDTLQVLLGLLTCMNTVLLYTVLLHKWHSLLFPVFTAAWVCLPAFSPLHQVAHSSPVKLFIMRTVPRSHTLPDGFWVLYLSVPHNFCPLSKDKYHQNSHIAAC